MNNYEKEKILNIINSIKQRRQVFRATPCLQTEEEFIVLAYLISKCNHLDGNFAEIGTYEGFTSEFIKYFIEKEKILYLCDTFEGLADVSEKDTNINIPNGSFNVDIEKFKIINSFYNDSFVSIVPGYFPQSATNEMNNSKYAFVHIDTDTYLSTLSSLEYFYPLMVSDGIIVVHDFRNNKQCYGVNNAVNEFIKDKNVLLSTFGNTTQAIITKI
jgi:hypothetical protein